jgi:regulation of enolase protein 1 (concanavalin A-like superfamily)
MAFNPTQDGQFAGLAVRGDDARSLIYGITRISGARGTFRGLLAIAEGVEGQDPDTSGVLYAFNDVHLRLIRRGDTFTAQYSRDGSAFSDVGTVTAALSEGVSVGIGAANGQNCGENCDVSVNADFDSFEITVPAT